MNKTHSLAAFSLLIITAFLYLHQNTTESMYGYEEWKTKYAKVYPQHEEVYRKKIFVKNFEEVERHNARAVQGEESYYKAINIFSDITDQEFRSIYLQTEITEPSASSCSSPLHPDNPSPPESLDWSTKSYVTPIKDQGTCASGYSFAAISTIESARKISRGKLIPLSAQQIIDCSSTFGNNGCIRGTAGSAYQYVSKAGLTTEASYSYKGFFYTCKYDSDIKEVEILGCASVTPQLEAKFINALSYQPISVSINSNHIKDYSHGVFKYKPLVPLIPCKVEANHWMMMVGYGIDQSSKMKYWKLKNSWGNSWGTQGYMLIAREGDGEGECGVLHEGYYPIA